MRPTRERFGSGHRGLLASQPTGEGGRAGGARAGASARASAYCKGEGNPLSWPLMRGTLSLPNLDGYQISPGVTLIGQPQPIAGSDKFRCLAKVGSMLVVEIRIRFESSSPSLDLSPLTH